MLLRSNGQISEELFDAVLQGENYIYGSMNKFLSPSRYYERERRVFHAVVKDSEVLYTEVCFVI